MDLSTGLYGISGRRGVVHVFSVLSVSSRSLAVISTSDTANRVKRVALLIPDFFVPLRFANKVVYSITQHHDDLSVITTGRLSVRFHASSPCALLAC